MHRYLAIDVETSGLPLKSRPGEPPIPADAPGQPRLASFTAIATTQDLEVDDENSISTLIRPSLVNGEPEWRMQPGATAVNGITDERLQAEGIPVEDALAIYADYIDQGWIIVAHNAQFDTKVMRGALRIAGMDDRFHTTLNVCTMKACRALGIKPVNLQACYQHFYGEAFPDAHTSMADTRACLAVFRKLVQMGAAPEPSILYAKSRE